MLFRSGVVNIVTGDGPTAGAGLVTDPRVDKIAFTGGVDTGKLVIRGAAETIKRMSIELGGKNPNIVFADADFEAAVDGALFGAFANQGEVCSAGSRLLVERSIYDRMGSILDARRAGRKPAPSATALSTIAAATSTTMSWPFSS